MRKDKAVAAKCRALTLHFAVFVVNHDLHYKLAWCAQKRARFLLLLRTAFVSSDCACSFHRGK